MKLERVVFKVGEETAWKNCHKITDSTGEARYFGEDDNKIKLYTNLPQIWEKWLNSAKSEWQLYKRDCPGKRSSESEILFWSEMIAGHGNILLEEVI